MKSNVINGSEVYSRKMLSIYDFLVIKISNPFIWRCPSQKIRKHYDKYMTANHLDVGVGTGYFLDKYSFPVTHRLALLDVNENCLAVTAARLKRYQPLIFQANVQESLVLNTEPFESIGINYLLHCLPGSLKEKFVVVDHLLPYLLENGILFGSTILSGGVKHTFFSRKLMKFYNDKHIFCNDADDFATLKSELNARFNHVSITVVGCVALFAAHGVVTVNKV